jgi:hypothetical protein
MARVDRETWAKRVEAWKSSGLSAARYAPKIGVTAKVLSWWKWRLGEKWDAPRDRRTRSSKAVSPLTFVELSAPARSEPFEVVLRSGVRIRVATDFDAEALRRLVGVLDGEK